MFPIMSSAKNAQKSVSMNDLLPELNRFDIMNYDSGERPKAS